MRDHDRPLAHRGRVATRTIASYIAREHPLPELVITSSATRTLETTRLLIPRWKPPPRIVEDSSLYLATPREMLSRIHAVVDTTALMLVGHNPGIAELGCLLAGDPAAFGSKFPTAGLAVFRFPIDDWAFAEPGRGWLETFVRPRDLPARTA